MWTFHASNKENNNSLTCVFCSHSVHIKVYKTCHILYVSGILLSPSKPTSLWSFKKVHQSTIEGKTNTADTFNSLLLVWSSFLEAVASLNAFESLLQIVSNPRGGIRRRYDPDASLRFSSCCFDEPYVSWHVKLLLIWDCFFRERWCVSFWEWLAIDLFSWEGVSV